ncbi:MAG: alpha/beta hydrolase [Verrucomicrobia bacterium]|nr:alpha/beta hydrolase [Verrucomicrobiota bacterium]
MKTLLLTSLCLALAGGVAAPLPPAPVWDGVPPAETLAAKPGQDPKGIINKNGHRTDVMVPEYVAYPAAQPGAPLVIVCPGGGYGILAEEHEGAEVARRLNAFGSAAVVLRYRVPRRDPNKPWVVPELDARRMVQLARARAREWNADPRKVGILGFSAGGNLAARVAYAPAAADAARPDFAVMVYPAYLFEKDKPDGALREGPDGVVPPKGAKPVPAFFAHSADDPYPAEGSMALAKVLKSLGGSAEVHVWAKGGHGWGASERCLAARRWTDLLGEWMKDQGFLRP